MAEGQWCLPRGVDESQRFVALSVDANHGCAVTAESAVWCWGRNDHGEAGAPDGSFVDVSVAGGNSCGVHVDGSLSCWGRDDFGQLDVPAGRFVEVFPGVPTCALRVDGGFVCWAAPYDGALLDVPAGVFGSLSVKNDFACAVRVDGKVLCWGAGSPTGTAPAVAVDGEFSKVSVGSVHACALETGGDVKCWGSNEHGQAEPRRGPFVQVSAGAAHTCALGADAVALCWGRRYRLHHGDWQTPPYSFSHISAGSDFTCGVTTDTLLRCWNDESRQHGALFKEPDVLKEPVDEGFVEVAAGRQHACARHTGDTVACWGAGLSRQTRAHTGDFSEIAAAGHVFCGLRADRTLYCWGDDSTPVGEFEHISEGACGIRAGGQIECWSHHPYGTRQSGPGHSCRAQASHIECLSSPDIAAPPEWAGPIPAAARGGPWYDGACGIRADSTISCWDILTHRQFDTKEGAYTQLSMTTGPLCALSADGTPRCWRGPDPCPGPWRCWGHVDESIRSPSAPSGAFEQVAVGERHACGIRADGTVACWGSNYDTYQSDLILTSDDERENRWWWWWPVVLGFAAAAVWGAVRLDRRLKPRRPGAESHWWDTTNRGP